MTAVSYPAIRCNGSAECDAETHHPTAWTVTEVRRFRAAEGWHQRPGGRDIRPDCWSTGHR